MAERKRLSGPIEDRITHRMIGGVHVTDTAATSSSILHGNSRWQAVLRAFPGERVHLVSTAADFRKLIVRVEARGTGSCSSWSTSTHTAPSRLGDVYEGVTRPFEVRRITYAAADGLQIPAYLTLPRGKPPQKLPLVVLPHGGPRRATARLRLVGAGARRPGLRGAAAELSGLGAQSASS